MSRYKFVFHSIFALLGFFCFVLLVISFVYKTNNSSYLTFRGFLDWLSSVNTTHFSVNVQDFTIVADWGIFNAIRDFLNIFGTMFGIIFFFGANLLNLLLFVSQFLVFIFA